MTSRNDRATTLLPPDRTTFGRVLSLLWFLVSATGTMMGCSDDPSPVLVDIELVELDRRPPGAVFVNPIVQSRGADPHMTFLDGEYFLLTTASSSGATVRHAATVAGLADAVPTVLWEAGRDGSPCCHWWAPELHRLDGRHQLYVSAGPNILAQRMFVLESEDAFGPYELRRIGPDVWSIDHSVLEVASGERYLVWSGHLPSSLDQGLFIARMSSPVEIESDFVMISSPDEDWERRDGRRINEGPIALELRDQIHLVFSASHSQTDDYCLGAITLEPGGDPLRAASWTKSNGCLFEKNADASVYGPGHGSFVASPDGSEIFNVYHAHVEPSDGTSWPTRFTRMQQIGSRRSGQPVFGRPVSADTELAVPSGEPGSDRTRVEAEYGVMDDSVEVVWDREASSGQSARARVAGLTFPPVDAGPSGSSSLLLRYRAEEAVSVTVEFRGVSRSLRLPATGGRYLAARFPAPLPQGRHEVVLTVDTGELWVDALESE